MLVAYTQKEVPCPLYVADMSSHLAEGAAPSDGVAIVTKTCLDSTCLCWEGAHVASSHLPFVKTSPEASPDIKKLCSLLLSREGRMYFV